MCVCVFVRAFYLKGPVYPFDSKCINSVVNAIALMILEKNAKIIFHQRNVL